MLCEEEFERVQFLRDTFDVVQPIDSDDDLYAIESLLERRDALLHRFLL